MPTLDFCCGAECEVDVDDAPPWQSHWNVAPVGGVPTLSQAVVYSGKYSYKMECTALRSYWQRSNFGVSTDRVIRVAYYFDTLPDVDNSIIACIVAAGAVPRLRYRVVGTELQPLVGATATGATALSIVSGRWYIIDWSCSVGGATRTSSARVTDTVTGITTDLGTASAAVAASTIANWRVGIGTQTETVTGISYVDDIATGGVLADYPLPRMVVSAVVPNADGTHNFSDSSDFAYNDVTGIAPTATDIYTYLNGPLSHTIGSFIAAQGPSIGEYIEVAFSDISPKISDVYGVEVISSNHAAGTLANRNSLRIAEGGSESSVYEDLDISVTSILLYSQHFATAPSGGVWTPQKVNNLVARYGSSWTAVDTSPTPYLNALRMEVAHAPLRPSLMPVNTWGWL